MICSNNMVTWETGCKQILLHPSSVSGVWADFEFYCIFLTISQWSWQPGDIPRHCGAEFSSLVVTTIITMHCNVTVTTLTIARLRSRPGILSDARKYRVNNVISWREACMISCQHQSWGRSYIMMHIQGLVESLVSLLQMCQKNGPVLKNELNSKFTLIFINVRKRKNQLLLLVLELSKLFCISISNCLNS